MAPPDLSSSGTGVFGGRGGGGGPGFAALDEARARFGGAGAWFANLPASAIGGGALKTGLGGPGGGVASRVGECGAGLCDEVRLADASCRVRRAGGGCGGGPRFDVVVLPVCWGLRGAPGGGGGGGALDRRWFSSLSFSSDFLCSMYSLMKSAFSSIWSSVIPMANSSLSKGCHEGSVVSIAELRALVALEWLLCTGEVTEGGMMECAGGAAWEELRCPKIPPKRPWPWPPLFPFVEAILLPTVALKGLLFVFLWAFFSRSSSFFLNVRASFSSAKDRPARQSSSSKVWKKTRSWL